MLKLIHTFAALLLIAVPAVAANRITVLSDETGAILAPTNFFRANSNRIVAVTGTGAKGSEWGPSA